ncbi:MAG TPA: DUF1800 domain-containing protein, partial [Longimicrobium sp.]|nr:DUF1800 domain-containing protein [Longimicrobium sp.]
GLRPRPVLVRRAPADPNPPSREDTLRALHLLGRATFGARPEDLAEVLRIGPDAWLDRQLHPARIDDSALQARLARFPAAAMSVGELLAAFPRPDPAARAGRDSLRREREANAGSAAMRPGMAPDSGMVMRPDGAAFTRARRAGAGAARGPQAILFELAGARLQRAVYSDRQLQEVMTDFWFNHFNVFFGKNLDRYLVAGYERDAIRPRVFGRFRDLLGATAKHPAMLVYLDNARSMVADSMRRYSPAPRGGVRGMGRPSALQGGFARGRPGPLAAADSAAAGAQRVRGLNENYARELMELHTLGVEGGYTQHDVVDVARALTGWSVDRGMGRGDGEIEPRFVFRPQLHDFGPKTILGHDFPAGRGQDEGEAVLDLLARSPATARHVAYQLAQRFVADDPPPALVERLAQTFLRTDGDLAAVTRALFTAPELYDARFRGTKVKTPLEFVASALRAAGADVGPSRGLLQALRQLGQVPYLSSAPTGYPATSVEWTNSGAMLNRMNFALALAAGRIDGVTVDAERFRPALREPGTPARVAALARALMPAGGDPRLLATIAADLDRQGQGDGTAAAARALGLLLGSPDFQRR